MRRKTPDYEEIIRKALKILDRDIESLEPQIFSLAGALCTLALANEEIDELESTTITTVSRYGNETLAPHPVFKIQKDAQLSVTKQMKALGLTASDLKKDEPAVADPLYELTQQVKEAGRKSGKKAGRKTNKKK